MTTSKFVLEPLGPEHNEADFEAWSTSIQHIRATPGFRADLWAGDDWPYPMTLDQNLADLTQHAEEFDRGEAFAYTVLDPWSADSMVEAMTNVPNYGFIHSYLIN